MAVPFLATTHRGVVPFPADLIYRTLADYDVWQHWMAALASSKLLTREDVLAIVELGPNGDRAEALMLEVIETPGKGVLARPIEGKAGFHEVEWTVEAAGPGLSNVSMTVRRKFGLGLLGGGSRLALNPAECVAGLKAWLASANPGPEVVEAGENLFELWETEAGLMCWIRGRKYKLTPVDEGPA
jgi:hypothetical protein